MTLPPYLRIAQKLQEQIETGYYNLGERFPSIAEIARREGVATQTAFRAIARLRDTGFVETSSQGTFVKRRDKPRPTLHGGLSLSEGLVEFLDRCGWDGADLVQDVLDEHAHRLAEKQREWLRFQGYDTNCVCEDCGYCRATEYIDLIDPDKEA